MHESAKYVKLVKWSNEDKCFIGRCPELFSGGCHGDNEREVFEELCQIVEETIDFYQQDGKPLPSPLTGKELLSVLQKAA
ncbi:MAG: hypothetical protein HYR67_07615 [Bacteroidetes bacterium]|nr:hypothetical protein [Bacteroidota bacterium]